MHTRTESLLIQLINRKIIKEDTTVKAKYRGKDLSGNFCLPREGDFNVIKFVDQNGNTKIKALCKENNLTYTLPLKNIIGIDGMDIEKVAKAHRVKL